MSNNHVYVALRGRLHKQIERNHELENRNRILLDQIRELEQERRQADSELVRLIKRMERSMVAIFRRV